jgi:hypothetical protein
MFEYQEPLPQMEEVELIVENLLRGDDFNMDEDKMLVWSWIGITLNAVQENEQRHKKYCQRICELFHEQRPISHLNQNSLMNKLAVIQQALNKFCGYFVQVELRPQNGLTEQDKICFNYDFLSIFLYHVLFIQNDSNYVDLLIFQIGKAKLMYQEFQNNNISLFFGFMNGSFGIQNFILCF